jgi:hypothetical protein
LRRDNLQTALKMVKVGPLRSCSERKSWVFMDFPHVRLPG